MEEEESKDEEYLREHFMRNSFHHAVHVLDCDLDLDMSRKDLDVSALKKSHIGRDTSFDSK